MIFVEYAAKITSVIAMSFFVLTVLLTDNNKAELNNNENIKNAENLELIKPEKIKFQIKHKFKNDILYKTIENENKSNNLEIGFGLINKKKETVKKNETNVFNKNTENPDIEKQQLPEFKSIRAHVYKPKQDLNPFQKVHINYEPQGFTSTSENIPSGIFTDESIGLNKKINVNHLIHLFSNNDNSNTEKFLKISETVVQKPVDQFFYKRRAFLNESLRKADEGLDSDKQNLETFKSKKLLEHETGKIQDEIFKITENFYNGAEYEGLSVNTPQKLVSDLSNVKYFDSDYYNKVQQSETKENLKTYNHGKTDQILSGKIEQITDEKKDKIKLEVNSYKSKIPFQDSNIKNTKISEDFCQKIQEIDNKPKKTFLTNKKLTQTDLLENIKSEENAQSEDEQFNFKSSIPKIKIYDEKNNSIICFDNFINEVYDPLLDLKNNRKDQNLFINEYFKNNHDKTDNFNSQIVQNIITDQIPTPQNVNFSMLLDLNNTIKNSELRKPKIIVDKPTENFLITKQESVKKLSEQIKDVLKKVKTEKKRCM
ncbi:hypothetical protein GVAV_001842 [Gurleya vavrai]